MIRASNASADSLTLKETGFSSLSPKIQHKMFNIYICYFYKITNGKNKSQHLSMQDFHLCFETEIKKNA